MHGKNELYIYILQMNSGIMYRKYTKTTIVVLF